jgi:hypothetical protein
MGERADQLTYSVAEAAGKAQEQVAGLRCHPEQADPAGPTSSLY